MKYRASEVETEPDALDRWDITCFSGVRFRFDQPEFKIEDIAHALARICRYNGHSREFYSVAQHCCLVSDRLPSALRFPGLMHDAAEAYLGDMTAPLKLYLPAYMVMEEKMSAAVAAWCGYEYPTSPLVKEVDLAVTLAEAAVLMPDRGRGWYGYPQDHVPEKLPEFECWGIYEAEENFLLYYRKLTKGRKPQPPVRPLLDVMEAR
jgi:hypothetical protein